ncbi:MAG: flavodoxin family protein [bacterium]
MEIMYSSISGNTKKLAELINDKINAEYCGKIKEVNSDTVYVGFWTTKNSCSDDVKRLLESLNDKKVFLFGTCGYNNTDEFYNEILTNVKANINSSNTIIGEFVCQAKVSEQKMKALQETNPNFDSMKPLLDESLNRPLESDLTKLVNSL